MIHIRSAAFACALFLLSVISSAASAAFPVQVNTGAFTGAWDVPGQTGALSGNQTINLDAGNYQLRVGRQNLGAFFFDIDRERQRYVAKHYSRYWRK